MKNPSSQKLPRKTARKAAAGVAYALHARIKKIDSACNALKHVDKTEALHDFRVNVRRLRTLLRAFSDAVPVPRRLMRELRKLAQSTNDTRDLQVAAQILIKIKSPLRTRAPDANRLRCRLYKKTAAEQASELAHRLPKDWAQLRFDLMKRLPEPGGSVVDVAYRHATHQQLATRFTALERQLRTLQTVEQLDHLHRARILTKELRYLLEPFSTTQVQLEPAIRSLAQLQDALGTVHDLMLLRVRVRTEALQQQEQLLLKCFDARRAKVEFSTGQMSDDIALYHRLYSLAKRQFGTLGKLALGNNAAPLLANLREPCDVLRGPAQLHLS